MHLTDVWEGRSAAAASTRGILTPLSWLYALGWSTYAATYALGLKRPAEPHRPVVCVGNLVSGGSGKSPLTLYVAALLREMGRSVVISCSGYGSRFAEAARLAPTGELSAKEWGDEAAMFRLLLPDVELVVGRRRVLAAQIVGEHRPGSVMLMDDGFQHLPLRKHVTILLDPERPVNSLCLPAGPYREPRSNRRRADLVLPGEFRIEYTRLELRTPDGAPDHAKRVQGLCALGQPTGFRQALEDAGIDVVRFRALPDHDPMDAPGLFNDFDPDLPIAATSKDWVKLRERRDLAGRTILVAHRQARVEPADAFRDWLKERLDD